MQGTFQVIDQWVYSYNMWHGLNCVAHAFVYLFPVAMSSQIHFYLKYIQCTTTESSYICTLKILIQKVKWSPHNYVAECLLCLSVCVFVFVDTKMSTLSEIGQHIIMIMTFTRNVYK